MASGPVLGDFGGDGRDDLAIGVVLEGIGTIISAGAVNVLLGSASSLQAVSPDERFGARTMRRLVGLRWTGVSK